MQLGADSPDPHNLSVPASGLAVPTDEYADIDGPVVVPPESLASGSKTTDVANGLVPESFDGFTAGGGNAWADNVDELN